MFRSVNGSTSNGVSSEYNTAEDACLQGWNEIKDDIWGGAFTTQAVDVEYVGGDRCRVYDSASANETITWLSINSGSRLFLSIDNNLNLKTIMLPDGRQIRFKLNPVTNTWSAPFQPNLSLEEVGTDWVFTDTDDSNITYNSDFVIVSSSTRDGKVTTYEHTLDVASGGDGNDETLDKVTGPFGRSLTFSYTDIGGELYLTTLGTPDGDVVYAYDSEERLETVTYPDLTVRTYHYEDTNYDNLLTGITDENGDRYATYGYNADGKAILSEKFGGAEKTTLSYETNGDTIVTDALGSVSTYEFEIVRGGRLVKNITGDQCMTCPGGDRINRTYDSNGFLDGYDDWKGNHTDLINNSRGLVTSITDAVGELEERTTTITWDPVYSLPTDILEPGRTTILAYYPNGLLHTRTVTDTASGDTRVATYTYTPEGLLETIDGPRIDVTDITTYAYHPGTDNISTITNALGHITQITTHDAAGRPTTIIDPNNVTILVTYDLRGRVDDIDVAGQLTDFIYDDVGQLEQVTLGDGSFIKYEYDEAHRLDAIEDALGNRIDYTLDAAGNITDQNITDPLGTLTQTQTAVFDTLGRLEDSIGADNQIANLGYDLNHNLETITDPNGHLTVQGFDALNRLIEIIDPETEELDPNDDPADFAAVTIIGYDDRDNVTSVTDAEGKVTTYIYTAFDQVRQQISPDTGVTLYVYDEAGNRKNMIDARGITTTYEYDELNRLKDIIYPDSSLNVTYTYDDDTDPTLHGVGRLTSRSDSAGVASYGYDDQGNLSSDTLVIDGLTFVTSYTYDDANRIDTITYPSTRVVDYDYDLAGQATTVTTTYNGTSTPLASNITHAPFGRINNLLYANGLTLINDYDLDYRFDNISAASSNTNALNLSYGYDDASNIDGIINAVDMSQTKDYDYDEMDRLISETGEAISYTYDDIGNRLTETLNGVTDTYAYDSAAAPDSHHLSSITPDGQNSFIRTYDQIGNTRLMNNFTLSYGDHNRLETITQTGGAESNYLYNAMGQRIHKTTPTTEVYFRYGLAGELLHEANHAGEAANDYIWLNGQILTLANYATTDTSNPNVITDNPPVANFVFNYNYGQGGVQVPSNTAIVNGLPSTDDGTIVSYDWDFGNGNTDTGTAAVFDYGTPGTYTVTLTVTDDAGQTDTITKTFTANLVINQPPVADFFFTYSYGQGGVQVPTNTANANGISSTDDGTIVSYAWDFGDSNTGSGQSASHTYTANGTYTVTLTVTDDGGLTNSTTKVFDANLPISNTGEDLSTWTASSNVTVTDNGDGSATITDTTSGGSCPASLTGYDSIGELNGKAFFLSQASLNHNAAITQAATDGAELASIHSEAENELIRTYIDTINKIVHIGLSDQVTEGTNEWADGSTLDFTKYDGSNGNNSGDNDFALMNFWNGEWELVNQWVAKRYVVQVACAGEDPALSNTLPTIAPGETVTLTIDAESTAGGAILSTDDAGLVDNATDIQIGNSQATQSVTYINSTDSDITSANVALLLDGNNTAMVYSLNITVNPAEQEDLSLWAATDATVTTNGGTTTLANSASGSSCPATLTGYDSIGQINGKAFYLSQASLNHNAAKTQAATDGAELASIHSEAENELIRTHIDNINKIVHIGLSDQVTEGTNEWADGSALDFTKYDGSNGNNSGDNDFALMNFWNGEWELVNQWVAKRYVVQVTCGSSGTVSTTLPTIPDGGSVVIHIDATTNGVNSTFGITPSALAATDTSISLDGTAGIQSRRYMNTTGAAITNATLNFELGAGASLDITQLTITIVGADGSLAVLEQDTINLPTHENQTMTAGIPGNPFTALLLLPFIWMQRREQQIQKKAKALITALLLVMLPLAAQAMPDESLYMVHNDHLGTPKAMTDMYGDVAWTSQADPFGQTTVNEDADGDGTDVTLNVRFPGQYFDQESGLHYNYFRYYDPSTGRYVTSDPIGLAAGVNTYGYVGGNPAKLLDYFGLDVTINIVRTDHTALSNSGVITAYSDITNNTYVGDFVENRNPPNPALPTPSGTYQAFVDKRNGRKDRVELLNVPNASDIQIHVANRYDEVIGCFGPGTRTSRPDWVSSSGAAMDQILDIIKIDGSGNIEIIISDNFKTP